MDKYINLANKSSKYYLTEVDKREKDIYCHHDLMGEHFIETHKHDKAQFLYTEGGLVYVKTSTQTYFLPARHYMWIPAGITHSIYPSSPEVKMRNLYFPVKKDENIFYSQEGIYPVNNLLLQLLLFTKQWNGNIKKSQKDKYPIVLALKVLLPQLSKQPLLLNLPQPKDERLIKISEYLLENLHKELKSTSIATHFNMSSKTLYRLFKKDVQISFIQYYTLLRMFKALEFLLTQQFTIAEVALKVGYNSVPTFSNTFTKIIGKRPSAYITINEIY